MELRIGSDPCADLFEHLIGIPFTFGQNRRIGRHAIHRIKFVKMPDQIHMGIVN